MLSFSEEGAIVYTTPGGDQRTIPSGSLAAGIQHVLRFQSIDSGTTASSVVGYTWLPAE